jgi:hypothetical protein
MSVQGRRGSQGTIRKAAPDFLQVRAPPASCSRNPLLPRLRRFGMICLSANVFESRYHGRQNLILFNFIESVKNYRSFRSWRRQGRAQEMTVIDAAKAVFWSKLYFWFAREGFDGR